MNLTVKGYNFRNLTEDFLILHGEVEEIDRFEKEYWFFTLFLTKFTIYIYGGITIIGLIANLLVILGKYFRLISL